MHPIMPSYVFRFRSPREPQSAGTAIVTPTPITPFDPTLAAPVIPSLRYNSAGRPARTRQPCGSMVTEPAPPLPHGPLPQASAEAAWNQQEGSCRMHEVTRSRTWTAGEASEGGGSGGGQSGIEGSCRTAYLNTSVHLGTMRGAGRQSVSCQERCCSGASCRPATPHATDQKNGNTCKLRLA